MLMLMIPINIIATKIKRGQVKTPLITSCALILQNHVNYVLIPDYILLPCYTKHYTILSFKIVQYHFSFLTLKFLPINSSSLYAILNYKLVSYSYSPPSQNFNLIWMLAIFLILTQFQNYSDEKG